MQRRSALAAGVATLLASAFGGQPLLAGGLVASAAGLAASSAADPFKDPIDVAAARTTLPTATPINALTAAGRRLVGVGIRGLVILSDDAGATWQQASVPVSSDLTAVQFVTPQLGWIAGHDGVVLHSADGGAHWVKQLDGRIAARLLTQHYEALVAKGDSEAKPLLAAVQQNYAAGPEQALLGVWFRDQRQGYVCGSFGTLLATQDGGKTWQSAMERIDNPKLLHLNSLTSVGSGLLIASEQGTVFRLDAQRQRFVVQPTGYAGSFFGFVGIADDVLAYGLRGTVYRSRDGGSSWHKLSLSGAGLNGGAVFDDGTLALVSQDGRVLLSSDRGDSFRQPAIARPSVFTSIVQAGPGAAVVGGLAGVSRLALR